MNYAELMQNASSGFDPLPAGDYDVEVVKSENTTSSTGKTMFKVQMKVLNGPHAGRIVFNQFVVSPTSPNALGFFFQHMRVLGLDGNYFAQNPSEEAIAAALVGRRCRVTVAIRTYQGNPTNTVKKLVALAQTPAGPAAAAAPAAVATPAAPAAPAVPPPPF